MGPVLHHWARPSPKARRRRTCALAALFAAGIIALASKSKGSPPPLRQGLVVSTPRAPGGVVARRPPAGSHARLPLRSTRVHASTITAEEEEERSSAAPSLGRAIQADFPILDQTVHDDKPLLYLDSAATSQNPRVVTQALRAFSERSSDPEAARASCEAAREEVAGLIHASSPREVVFTRGATEAINMVARGWGDLHVSEGDEIILSVMEHHSNLVPWQALAERKGAKLKFVTLTQDQTYDIEAFKALLNPGKTKIVAMNHVSNVLGAVNPVEEVVRLAHEAGAKVALDACQSVPHMPVDVQTLGVDFLSASGHKMLGPTGIGFLWAPLETLESMDTWQTGAGTTEGVSLASLADGATISKDLRPVPWRLEAGQPPIAEAAALGEACRYLRGLGMERVHDYEVELGGYLWSKLSEIKGISLYGPAPDTEAGKGRGALLAFNVPGVHSNDLAFFLDQEGVAIRSGHHCTQPLHRALGVGGSARASLYVYNTKEDIDRLVVTLKRTLKLFSDLGFGVEEEPPCPLVSKPDPTLRDPGMQRPCTDLWPHELPEAEDDRSGDDAPAASSEAR